MMHSINRACLYFDDSTYFTNIGVIYHFRHEYCLRLWHTSHSYTFHVVETSQNLNVILLNTVLPISTDVRASKYVDSIARIIKKNSYK